MAEQLAKLAADLADVNLKVNEAAAATAEVTARWAKYEADKKTTTVYIGDGLAGSPRFERQRKEPK